MSAALLGCTGAPDLSEVEPVATTEVAVADNVFEPAVIAVEPGDTVTWTWEGDLQHNVVGEGAGVELSTDLQVEGTYEATVDAEGVVAYRCTIHPAMVGEVRVTASSSGGGAPQGS